LAKKRDSIEVKHVPTRRQLSRHRRQERIQHIIYIAGAVFLAALIGFLGWAFWTEQIKPYHQTAVTINGVTYNMDYYVKSLSAYAKMTTTGTDSSQVSSAADQTINFIRSNQALVKYAPELGISATKDEIDTALESNGWTDNQPNRDAIEAQIVASKLIQNHFDKQIPASVEQVNAQALFVESQDIADKARAKAAAGDNFTALVDEYDLEPLTKAAGGNLGWLPKDFAYLLLGSLGNSALKDIPFTLQAGEVSQPTFDGTVSKSVGYWVVQVTETDPTKGNYVRGILTGSRHDADVIREKILAGEDFAGLVKSYSQDYDSASLAGELGWTGEATISNRTVLGLAMPLGVGDVSEPAADSSVKTIGGYWVVKVIDRDDNKTLDNNTRQTLISGLFQNWLMEKMNTDVVNTVMTDQQKSWAIDLVVKSRG